MRLILASGSERRRTLLRQMGYSFEVVPANVPEDIAPGFTPEQVAEMLAERKAAAVAAGVCDALVIGADTIVAVDEEIIGKPRDRADARRILRRLRGTTQRVITGVCLIDTATGRRVVTHETSIVHAADVSDEAIDRYVDSGLGDDKAGAYAVQEADDPFIESIEGSFDNVVGLPTELLARLLGEFGVQSADR